MLLRTKKEEQTTSQRVPAIRTHQYLASQNRRTQRRQQHQRRHLVQTKNEKVRETEP